ncbi:hypothetical protein NFI96_034650, partial [Prochilodus magdalenae]
SSELTRQRESPQHISVCGPERHTELKMHLYSLRVPLLLLTAITCCFCAPLLPLKISGVRGKNVTFSLTIPAGFNVNTVMINPVSSTGESSDMFTFNGQKATVYPPYTDRVFYNPTNYEFRIGPLTSTDSGEYVGTVMSPELKAVSGRSTLEVLEPVAEVMVTSDLPEAVEFNSTVILTCSAKGSYLSYTWLNGSTPVVADGKHFILNGSKLIVTKVLRTDLRGPIYCVNNLESVTSTAFNLSVSYGPEMVTMEPSFDNPILKKGSNLTMSCSAVSSPAAELKWLFNGAELPQKSAVLTLTNLEASRNGNYSCVAYNSKTKRYAASQVVTISIIPCCFCAPLLPLKISGVRGKNVTFSLTIPAGFVVNTVLINPVSSTGESSDMFTFNGQKATVYPPYTDRVFYNPTNYEFRIGPLTSADSGEYVGTVMSPELKAVSGRSTLEVLEPVAEVTVTSDLPEAVEFNSTVILTCSAKGSYLSYTWLNGSTPVVADGKHFILNGSKLIVTEVLRTDLRGPIYCVAKNNLESVTSTAFNLSVSYGPEMVTMKTSFDNPILKKGSNLTLSCSAVSSPAAELKWIFNGAELPQKSAVLTLTNLEENQNGNYSCVAYNIKTKRYAASQVVTISIIQSVSGTNITGPTSSLIAGYSMANLTCKSSMGRADSVSWFKDEKPLALSDRIIVTPDKSTISILKVQKEDAGVYKCQLVNKVGTDTNTYLLQINYGPEKASIEGPKKVEVDAKVVMNCKVESFPSPSYSWKFNDKVLLVKEAVYKIEKSSFQDTGVYTCEAYNYITGLNQTATHNLLVKGEGELNDQLSNGAIAAIIIAVLLVVAIVIGIIIRRRRKPSDFRSCLSEFAVMYSITILTLRGIRAGIMLLSGPMPIRAVKANCLLNFKAGPN